MANTRIQVKRSSANSTIPALYQGELAYSQNGTGSGATSAGLLYIGRPSDNAAVAIGGVYNFGTLTACQALVVNATSYVDKFLTANLVVVGNVSINGYMYANGILGVAGNVLTTNATGGVYWGTVASGGVTMNFGNGINGSANPFLTSGTVYANLAASNPGLGFTSGGFNVLAANGISLTAAGVNVLAGNGHVVNSTGVHVIANSGITANATGVFVNLDSAGLGFTTGGLAVVANSGIIANATGVFVLANSGIIANATGVFVKPDTAISVGASGTQVNLASTPGLITTSGLAVKPDSAISVGASGVQVNTSGTSSGLTTTGGLALVVNTSQLVLTTGGLTHNTTGVVTLQDLTLNGNLNVAGTLVTLDATNLSVKDNMIILADQWANTTGAFQQTGYDVGLYTVTGNSSINCYSGVARIASSSTNTQPYFRIFATNTAVNTTTLSVSNTGYLESFLVPYGAGGLFVVNGSNISISGNSTVTMALAANTLSLTTPLPLSNLVANTTAGGTTGVDGTVLQISSTSLTYGMLDGGTF